MDANFEGTPNPVQPAQYKTHNTPVIDTVKGPLNQFFWNRPMVKDANLMDIKSNLGDTPYKLLRLGNYSYSGKAERLANNADFPKKYSASVGLEDRIEKNRNEHGKDCNLYSYSASPIDPQKALGENELQYTKTPLKDPECRNNTNKCLLYPRDDRFQIHGIPADRGLPVFCGKDNKLTYLASLATIEGTRKYAHGHKIADMWPAISSGRKIPFIKEFRDKNLLDRILG